jgi:hypothetical protein
MIIAAAGGQETEIVGQAKQSGSFCIRLFWVKDLDPSQARGGQPGNLLVAE